MKFYSLAEIVDKKSSIKSILRGAVFDEAITVFVKVPYGISVWQFNLDARQIAMLPFMGIESTSDVSAGSMETGIDGLILDASDLGSLVKKESVVVDSFAQGIVFSREGNEIYDLVSPLGEGVIESVLPSWRFFLFKPCKASIKFIEGQHLQLPVTMDDLYISVDVQNVQDKSTLIKLLPDLFALPEKIQERLKALPRAHNNTSSRLNILRKAFKNHVPKYKDDIICDRQLLKSVQKNLEQFLVSEFESKNDSRARTLGKGVSEFSADILLPEFLTVKDEVYINTVSKGVSMRFWFVLSTSLALYESIKAKEVPKGISVEDIAGTIYAFNRDKERDELNYEQDMLLDTILNVLSELIHYFDFKFSHEHSLHIARLIIPQV